MKSVSKIENFEMSKMKTLKSWINERIALGYKNIIISNSTLIITPSMKEELKESGYEIDYYLYGSIMVNEISW